MKAPVFDERPFLLFNLSPGQRSARGLWLLLGYYLFSILFGAVMASPTYWLVEWMNIRWPSELTDYLLSKRLDNYFERMRMVPLLLGLPWIMWVCHLLSLKALGLDLTWQNLRSACGWFLVGVTTLGAVALGQVCFAGGFLKNDHPDFLGAFLGALAGALIVAVIEEIVMRGIVLRIFFTAFGRFWAVILSSAFYAYTHFKVPGELVSAMEGDTQFSTGFSVGFWTLFGIFKGFSLVEFLVLFGLGCAIGQLFLKTKTLLPCIGLHCGIVFMMLFYRSFYQMPDEVSHFWGNVGFKDAVAALIMVALLNLWLWFYGRRGAPEVGGSKS